MSTIHHLKYVLNGSSLELPTGSQLSEQIKSFTLSAGDTIRMTDGSLFAKVVENLTDFDGINTEDFCNDIVKHEKSLALMKMHEGKLHFVQYVYADRRVVTTNGDVAHQVLGVAFGEPAWVNVGDAHRCYNRSCYDDNKPKYTHNHQLMPLVC